MSQALVWIYFTTKMPDLYKYSIRGAQEVAALLKDARSSEQQVQQNVAKAIEGASAVVGMDKDAFKNTLAQVGEDPYTKFLVAIWGQPTATAAAAHA